MKQQLATGILATPSSWPPLPWGPKSWVGRGRLTRVISAVEDGGEQGQSLQPWPTLPWPSSSRLWTENSYRFTLWRLNLPPGRATNSNLLSIIVRIFEAKWLLYRCRLEYRKPKYWNSLEYRKKGLRQSFLFTKFRKNPPTSITEFFPESFPWKSLISIK